MERDVNQGGNRPPTKVERSFEDLQNEIAGRSVGRIKRFMPGAASEREAERERKREREHISALAMLMQDPAYAALYNETMDKLRKAEAATEIALDKARECLTQARDALADLRGQASTLPDGTRVFRDGSGNVYTEDGRLIEGDLRNDVRWREGSSSYEDYLAGKWAADEAQATYDDILRYRDGVLGNARERITDEDNPPSKDELREIQGDIKDVLDKVSVQNVKDTATPEQTYRKTSDVSLPNFGG